MKTDTSQREKDCLLNKPLGKNCLDSLSCFQKLSQDILWHLQHLSSKLKNMYDNS